MNLKLEDFQYPLPDERIAKYPLENRDDAKLLVYKSGKVAHKSFSDIIHILNTDDLLVFNNTKVIPARIIMYKNSGARIELFLLNPQEPQTLEEAMTSKNQCSWKCMIGNAKKWDISSTLQHPIFSLTATRTSWDEVTFSWSGEFTFLELLVEVGKIPLPPYLKRDAEELDAERYQTVYSKNKGAVASPTAGLHFTKKVLHELYTMGVKLTELTLHISAGTFQPIKTGNIQAHQMHNEKVLIQIESIQSLIRSSRTIAVGTTSMRTLESLYWYGIKLHEGETTFRIRQNDPYTLRQDISMKDSLEKVVEYMQRREIQMITGDTEIFLYPGYSFRICEGLITNFHQSGSTLLLLIAAFVGEDWHMIYKEALDNGYRFLSYGDSSFLLP